MPLASIAQHSRRPHQAMLLRLDFSIEDPRSGSFLGGLAETPGETAEGPRAKRRRIAERPAMISCVASTIETLQGRFYTECTRTDAAEFGLEALFRLSPSPTPPLSISVSVLPLEARRPKTRSPLQEMISGGVDVPVAKWQQFTRPFRVSGVQAKDVQCTN